MVPQFLCRELVEPAPENLESQGLGGIWKSISLEVIRFCCCPRLAEILPPERREE